MRREFTDDEKNVMEMANAAGLAVVLQGDPMMTSLFVEILRAFANVGIAIGDEPSGPSRN